MIELRTKEQILYNKRGEPQSVLIDYKVYKEMLELLEDSDCVKIIKERENNSTFSEAEFIEKLKQK
ncbi:MAG: hypothetical protein M0P61_13470 [Ignavibacteriaceae bacterium]|jgi:chromosome condensin MukBEF MukE localization factor|nr:hypothetical protein [Ignavibacteriaceae bacterium]